MNLFWGRHRHLIRTSLIFGAAIADLTAIGLSGLIAVSLRYGDFSVSPLFQSVGLLAPSYLLAALALRSYNLSSLRSPGRSVMSALLALIIAAAVGLSMAFALKVGDQFSRLETAYVLFFAVLLLVVVRAVGFGLVARILAPLISEQTVVLTDDSRRLRGERGTAIVDVRNAGIRISMSEPAFFDRIGRLLRDVDRVLLHFSDPDERQQWSMAMRMSGFDAEVIADVGDVPPIALSHWRDHTTLVISRGPLSLGERILKRAFDLLVTGGLLLAVGPVIALFALLVKLDSSGPAFFVQERIGRNNRTYKCFKLRSMRTDLADSSGNVSASREDARITRLGKFLRRTSIDELPQLFNVLLGDMSLVGPRPHALGSRAEGALFWEVLPDYWSRHAMKPGVTGLAQVRGFRGATHRRTDIERRVEADIEYINNWSIWLDLKILVATFRVAIHSNAY